jgi:hypothetical protein
MQPGTENQTARNTRRDAIIEKIRKLAKMTIANGCSEAEAEAALRALEKLKESFNVTQDELSLKVDAEGMIEDIFIVPVGGEGVNWTKYLDEVIKMNEVRMYFTRAENDELLGIPIPVVEIHVFGFPMDVAASIATIQIVQVAMKSAILRYKPNMSKKEKTAFQDGFAERITERLADMRRNKEMAFVDKRAQGQQLVVLKGALVKDAWKDFLREKNLHLGSAHYDHARGNARGAGRVAANDVNLGGNQIGGGQRRIS